MPRSCYSSLAVLALVAAAIVSSSSTASAVGNIHADKLKQGDPIGAFRVTKIGGASDDGVEPGDDLCYRCRYGSSPMVMVFARRGGPKGIQLAKRLDAAIGKHENSRLRGLFTFIGDDVSELKKQAQSFVDQSAVSRLPIVVAEDAQDGPLDYRLGSSDEVTIVIARDSQVVTTHVCKADAIDVEAVMNDVGKILE